MNFQPIVQGGSYGAGHIHGAPLGIILWGAGMEMLPDAGYPHNPQDNRYFHTNEKMHNTGWIWSSKAASGYRDRRNKSVKQSVLAYDPGTVSGKKVQLIEASAPGADGDGAEVKRRLLMLIEMEGNRSYVVDLMRLKGGELHESYLRGSEDEDMDLDADFQLTANQGTDLQQYLVSIGKDQGISKYRNMMKDHM